MCGIAGFISVDERLSQDAGRTLLGNMSHRIRHRGPDADGLWIDELSQVYFSHQRLSILDLSDAGAQPMTSQNGRFIISYNGEIYNFRQLKELLPPTVILSSNCDTEVLVECISNFGLDKTLQLIKGMFAFALWDQKLKKLILVRDHVGKKPLYYGKIDSKLVFASELKAFEPLAKTRLDISQKALNSYKYYGFIPAPFSIYKNIYKLPPGHIIEFELAQLQNGITEASLTKTIEYWRFQKQNGSYSTEELNAKIKSVVGDRMVSDVRLGAFLSGGIDSSLITSIMQEHSTDPIKSFSIGFTENEFDESRQAEKIAKHLGTDHTTFMVRETDCLNIIPDMPNIYDEPFSDYSQIPTAVLCKLTSDQVTVALTGDGGDEVFCGYERYFTLNKLLRFFRFLPSQLVAQILRLASQKTYNNIGLNGRRVHSIAGFLSEPNLTRTILRTLATDPNYKAHVPDFDAINDLSQLEQMMMIDSKLYLPDDMLVKVDRASMAASMELRAPLLDKELIEYAWRMPIETKIFPGSKRGKKPLYDLLCQYVPEQLVDRPKQGFSPPIKLWLKGELKDWAGDLISTETGLYNQSEISMKWNNFLSGTVENHENIWSILMAQSWAIETKNRWSI